MLDWSTAEIGSSRVRPLKGRPKTGPTPVGRGKTDSRHLQGQLREWFAPASLMAAMSVNWYSVYRITAALY